MRKQPFQKGTENPHGSLEVESRSREHHVDVVAEDSGIEVAAETVVCFEMSDYRPRCGECSGRDTLCRICNPTHIIFRICNSF